MDQEAYQALAQLGLPEIQLIALEDFECGDDELLRAKQNRSLVEYYFTCTPSLPLFILNYYPDVDIITYLDADLFFFADPAPLYVEMADHSISIIGHRFPPSLRFREVYGIYNVGWLSFRRHEQAFACLRWWRERCLEWCYDRVEDGRFADQKYLDDWPERFAGVVALRHKGANLAPWNLANYEIRADGVRVWVDDQPLIFFHFHDLSQCTDWLYNSNLADYRTRLLGQVRRGVYDPYLQVLVRVKRQILTPGRKVIRSLRWWTVDSRSFAFPSVLHYLSRQMRFGKHVLQGLWACQYFLVINGRVL